MHVLDHIDYLHTKGSTMNTTTTLPATSWPQLPPRSTEVMAGAIVVAAYDAVDGLLATPRDGATPLSRRLAHLPQGPGPVDQAADLARRYAA